MRPTFRQWLFSWRDLRLKLMLGVGLFIVGSILLPIGRAGLPLLLNRGDARNRQFADWFSGNDATRQALVTVQRDACPGAPFILPAAGFIGLLYGDPRGPYSTSSPHQGIDIFSAGDVGQTAVYAAYDGYITREADWRSTLIQRVPQDPLNPQRQIWLYYTHMADRSGNDFIDPAFAPGTREFFVEQGTLLGYTGNYSGNAARPVGIHLHFSIIHDDGNGRYTNELDFANSIDPSPYLGIAVHYDCATASSDCAPVFTCTPP